MDEKIKTEDDIMTSTSKVKCIMAEHDYCIKEDTLESDLPQDNFVGQIEVKSEFIDVNNRLTNNQDISNCNIEIKEEILETNSLEENFVGVGEIKSEFSEPSELSEPIDEYSNSLEFPEPVEHDKKQVQIEKPKMKMPTLITEALMNSPHGGLILSDIFKSISARHPYYKLENKSWQDTLRCTLITNNKFIKISENEFTHRNNHWILAKNLSKNLNAKLKSDIKAVAKKLNEKNLKLDIMAVDKANGVEIYKYVIGKSDLTPTNQKKSKPKIYECKACGVKSKDLSDFRGHTCFHELKCFYCGKYFKIQSDLQRHQMFYHSMQKKRLRDKNNLNYSKIHNKQLEKEKSGQFDTETQIKEEKSESNLSEPNFVGLCETKSEFSATNDDFIENQEVSEIDPLEVETENSSVMITIHDENKSFVNCPSLNCNYKTTEKDEFANHIALIHQGNITLNKHKKFLLDKGKKQRASHEDHIVKNSLGLSCPSLNCDFKTLLNEDMDSHINSIHTCHIKSEHKSHICAECGNQFGTKRGLEHHMDKMCLNILSRTIGKA
jgi:hypothetical protein